MKLRKIRLLLSILVAVTCFCAMGCSKDKKNSDDDGNISRASYVGLLGAEFGYDNYINTESVFSDVKDTDEYYSQIQACSEWGIIESSGEFKPNNDVTLQYAIETATKAVQKSLSNNSGKPMDDSELVGFYISNIADIDVSKPDMNISLDVASQIIGHALTYKNNLTIPQVHQAELSKTVKTADAGIVLSYDGKTGTLNNASGYKVGDIVYWESTESKMPMAVKITSLDNDVFTYEVPQIEEVYSSLVISGTYDGTIVDVRSASDNTEAKYGQKIYDEVNNYGMKHTEGDSLHRLLTNGVKVEKGNNYIRFKASAEGKSQSSDSSAKAKGEFIAEIKNIKVTLDYDSKNILSPNHVYANVSFDTNVSSTVTGSISKSIPLGEAWINVWGPVQLRLVFTANIGANGEVTISYTTENHFCAGWKQGTGLQKSFSSTPSFDYSADVTITAEVSTLADIVIGFKIFWTEYSKSIINAEVTTGLVAVGKMEGSLIDKGPQCIDVLVYVPLRWSLNQKSCILTDISSKLKHKQTIWNSETSKFKLHLHFEDGKRAKDDKCTRGENKEVIQAETDSYGNPFDELKLFEFTMLDFDFIHLDKYVIILNEGETADIVVSSLPIGYSKSDLVYEVKDSSVCSVVGGKIVAKGTGSTMINIKTSDGTYSVSLAVSVFESFSVEGFETL